MPFPQTKTDQTSLLARILPYLELFRPINVIIGMISIGVGALAAGSISPSKNVLIACISGGLIMAAANAINDFYDMAIDRINKPNRPLPSGKISPKHARILSLVLFGVGVLLGFMINPIAFLIAIVSSVCLYLYSSYFKRTILWGNFMVSILSGMAFIYGGVAVNRLRFALIPAGFAFLFHFGRELLKDIEDIKGDQTLQAKTFPIRFGLNPSRMFISLIFFLLIFLTLIPYIYGIFGTIYFFIVVVGVDFFLLYVIVSIWRDSSKKNLHRLSEWLKVDMIIGLIAILTGVYLN